jgi:uncharacterized protein YhaN
MRIESIHVDGFGVWNDRSWSELDPGLNVFHGPNETGKSTLMAFIRSVLFGFDRRGGARRYEPLNGGVHGGWLDLAIAERSIRIERKSGRHVRGTVAVYEAESSGGDVELDNLLGGTTRTLYHNVFAFGLEELEQFHTLQDSEVATHISGAGLGVGAARWSAVQRDLEERQSSLFLPRGQNSTINVAFKDLDAVRDDLDRTEQQPQEYWAAHEARRRLSAELSALEDIVGDLRKRVDHYEKRLRARPLIERRERLKEELKGLPSLDSFPEGGLERLQLLSTQIHNLNAERVAKQRALEKCKSERNALRSVADPQQIAMRTQVIQTLKSLMPRVDASRRVYTACVERRDAISHERATLDAALKTVRPPSQPAIVVFVLLIWASGAGFYGVSQPYIAASLFAVSLLPLLWYRSRLRSTANVLRQVSDCALRLDACTQELHKTEDEARQIEREIWRMTGKVEIAQSEIDQRGAELDELLQVGDSIHKVDEAIAQLETEIRMTEERIAETRASLSTLIEEGGAQSVPEFMQRAEIFKLRRQLMLEIEKIPLEANDTGFLFDMRAEEDAAYAQALEEFTDAEQRLTAARHETGRVDERISIMERSEERTRALVKQERVLARLDIAAEQWAVLTLCRAMLDETRRIYETDRQPQVLRQASNFFAVMTEGRYVRVFTPVDGSEIQVERADGVRLSPQTLSRGTAEQLYLCMRLALVREYANHVEPLPVVLDDIFVNFDPSRTSSSIRAVRELCATHQVLLFTCHPLLVQTVQEIVPTAKLFPLQ